MGKKLKNYILRYILVLFGYDYSVVIKNRFHNNRKDRINLIDLIVNIQTDGKLIEVVSDCKNATCVCCKDKGIVKHHVQIGHYISK